MMRQFYSKSLCVCDRAGLFESLLFQEFCVCVTVLGYCESFILQVFVCVCVCGDRAGLSYESVWFDRRVFVARARNRDAAYLRHTLVPTVVYLFYFRCPYGFVRGLLSTNV